MTLVQRTLIGVGAALGALAACGGAATPSPTAPVAVPLLGPVASASASAPVLPPLEGVYLFDVENSRIEAEGADKLTGKHTFWFESLTAQAAVESGRIRLSLEVPMQTLRTRSSLVEAYVKSPSFFNVERFPRGSFSGVATPTGEPGAYKVDGTLDLHGVQRPFSFPATIRRTSEGMRMLAAFSFSRHDFDIRRHDSFDSIVRLEVIVRLDMQAPRALASASASALPPLPPPDAASAPPAPEPPPPPASASSSPPARPRPKPRTRP